jgi:hypothetical protein
VSGDQRTSDESKLTLVVQQLLSCLGGVFNVLGLDNGVDGAGFLAETTVDTLKAA